ncbi:diguanylate cyclase [Candidatus Bipolaricaulota bacterium]|nr:diguanylate cyclase [Candidatus Bipolaricaulota bacterium]
MKRILFVDDEPNMLDGLRRMLRPMESQWKMTFLDSAEKALELLQQETVDAVVSDVRMPGMDGLQLLRNIRSHEHLASVAIVIMTGEGSESTAVKAMKSGAQDYLVKGSVTRELIEQTIDNAIEAVVAKRQLLERSEQITQLSKQLAEANVALSQTSRLDSMTRLLNREAWEEAITLEAERSVRYGHPYAVIMIDIDHFKQFNDALGHPAGDECLCAVARCIDQTTRAADMVGRYGGEEFIVLAPETNLDGAKVLGERIRSAIWGMDRPHPASKTAERVSVSVGVAVRSVGPWRDVVKEADEALYAAKNSGRNQVQVTTGSRTAKKCERVTAGS